MFLEEAEEVYSTHANHILPFVGEAFLSPREGDLRVLTVGINSYISAPDWEPEKERPHPGWFRGWYRRASHRFYRSVHKNGLALAEALARRSALFANLQPRWPDAFYGTNAVKVYLREEEGKKAHQVGREVFDRHVPQWRAELDLMAKHRVLPHLIIIFGAPFWSRAWRSFGSRQADGFESMSVIDYEPAAGKARHYANRVRLSAGDEEHELLLVRLRHPAARTKKGSVRWLLDQDGFQALCGLRER